ncbi:hypothetical protein BGZ73_007722 [Actinomortierella ambigua]|nr:hypothetical protein BGZ73_007722 [Actinomortierella ambigua]
MLTKAISIAILASVAYADITYSVVGYPSTSTNRFGVSVKGNITPLTTNDTIFPVWTGSVPSTAATDDYKYVELSSTGTTIKEEPFLRRLNSTTDTKTLNEFFERPITQHVLPRLPYTYLATFPTDSKAFKENQVATIHITAPKAQLDELLSAPAENTKNYKVDFRFINAKQIHSQTNVTFKISGKSSREHSKQAFKFKFDDKYGQSFFKRPNIKLRSMVMDPTMMRERLYIDMLNSAGVPTQQGAYVRLFINNEPMGLYLMVDDIKKSFLKQTVHGGDDLVKQGSLVQMNAFIDQADLIYRGAKTSDYSKEAYKSQNLGANPPDDPLQQLVKLMADLRDFDPVSTPDPVGYWNNTRLDLDGFLRNMALEYLGAAFDNYWMSASNYFMYFNPTLGTSGKWQWLPTDFDGTFGNGAPSSTVPSYKQWVDMTEHDRPLVSKLILKNKQIQSLFEETMKNLINYAFKPEVLYPRIDAYNKMLSEDAKWDIGITRKSPGTNNGFTFDDFNNNIIETTKSMTFGLKPYVDMISKQVAAELNFQILSGTEDRVKPPPKKKGQSGHDGDESQAPQRSHASTTLASKAMVAIALTTIAFVV